MKLIIDIDEKDYEELNTFYILNLGTEEYRKIIEKHCTEAIRHGTPYNPTGDLISREALIKWIDDSVSQYGNTYSTDMLNMWGLFKNYLINYAPTVEPFTQLEKEEIADAITYLLDAELLEENGYTEEVIKALKSALKKIGGAE